MKELLNRAQKQALIDGIWTGRYDKATLPDWLFNTMADSYEGAAAEGWGKVLGGGAVKDLQLELSMQKNIYYFAAHKTAHELQDMHNIFRISEGRADFVKRALEVNAKYNKHWYATEWNVTNRIARAGRQWRGIEATRATFPNLRFVAVMDKNTRDAHAKLNGIVKPVDDPFWKQYYPPLDWNCRCSVERLMADEAKVTPDEQMNNLPPVEAQFNTRVTDSGKIWHESHPYFSNLTPAAKAAAVKMAEAKIAAKAMEAKPFEFTTPEKLEQELNDIFKSNIATIDKSITKRMYEQRMGGIDVNRLCRNIRQDLKASGINEDINTISIRDRMGKLRLRIETESIEIIRDFEAELSGKKIVNHNYFEIRAENLQGKGLSKRVLKTLYTEYKAAGIEQINLHANLDVGGYAWAKYGFSSKYPDVEVIKTITDAKLKAKATAVFDAYKKANPDDSTLPMNLLADIKGMKQQLLGSSWHGTLNLKNKVQMQIFESYLK